MNHKPKHVSSDVRVVEQDGVKALSGQMGEALKRYSKQPFDRCTACFGLGWFPEPFGPEDGNCMICKGTGFKKVKRNDCRFT